MNLKLILKMYKLIMIINKIKFNNKKNKQNC